MSILTHIESLEDKKYTIEQDIASEMKRPFPHFARLAALKQQKLHIKEQIVILKRRMDESLIQHTQAS